MSDKNDKQKNSIPTFIIAILVIIGLIVLFLLAFYIEHIGLMEKLPKKLPINFLNKK